MKLKGIKRKSDAEARATKPRKNSSGNESVCYMAARMPPNLEYGS
jgi:hypothetical protein